MASKLRKGLQHLRPLREKLTSEKGDIYTGSAPLGALKLVVIASDVESDAFDEKFVLMLRKEGFSVTCLPRIKSCTQFCDEIERIDDELERGDFFAVTAFGKAASFALEQFSKPSWPNLRVVVAYYPDHMEQGNQFAEKFHVRIHLASSQTAPSDYAGIGFYCYQYPFSGVGFAERGSATYDEIDARLAWSRTLSALRTGFDLPNYIERVWDQYLAMDCLEDPVPGAMQTLSSDIYINYVPVLLGGRGRANVRTFHERYLDSKTPPSLQMRLVSRTVGSDHIVDEVHVAFKHTQEIPWLLPGVLATNHDVEVVIISIATIQGGAIVHTHTYWDQASVLNQIGLLDAGHLPVYGNQSAAKVLNENVPFANQTAQTDRVEG